MLRWLLVLTAVALVAFCSSTAVAQCGGGGCGSGGFSTQSGCGGGGCGTSSFDSDPVGTFEPQEVSRVVRRTTGRDGTYYETVLRSTAFRGGKRTAGYVLKKTRR